jgi:large subunit ribosomal protein L24
MPKLVGKDQKMRIKKGDKVKVIAGRDIGREGLVERVLRQEGRLIVSGVNQLKKFVKKGREGEPSGIITVPGPIAVSNVMLICPHCDKPTRVGFRISESGRKARVCKRCGKGINVKKK